MAWQAPLRLARVWRDTGRDREVTKLLPNDWMMRSDTIEMNHIRDPIVAAVGAAPR